MKLVLQRSFSRDGWSVCAHEYDSNGFRIPIKITIERGKPVSPYDIAEESLFLPGGNITTIVQALIDGLSEAGFLATSTPQKLQIEAMGRHLEDMRTLVFEKRESK